jgi:hypothetical protein
VYTLELTEQQCDCLVTIINEVIVQATMTVRSPEFSKSRLEQQHSLHSFLSNAAQIRGKLPVHRGVPE